MLGHGDFADHLMEKLEYVRCWNGGGFSLLTLLYRSYLNKSANSLSRYQLTMALNDATRSSSARHDSQDILRRLDVLMQGALQHGEIGWDVFTLEYRVDPPVNTIIDPDSMTNYMKLFNHLWQMKRVERALGVSWQRLVGSAKSKRHSRGEPCDYQPRQCLTNFLLPS